jgi:hypothetical protein
MSHTVLEEGDADQMLAEMIRVTRPGGRVVVSVRALDLPWWVNVPVSAELKARLDTPHGFVSPLGCADASLYRRFQDAGLLQMKMFPQLVAYDDLGTPIGKWYEAMLLGELNSEECQEWRVGVSQAEEEGTFFISQSFHGAIGKKHG